MKEIYKTPNGINLLKDWQSGAGYEANTAKARRAARVLFRSDSLVYIHGEKPRTASEFFGGMPYTSTSDFAAIWAGCNWEIFKREDAALNLDGIAIDDRGRAVAVWTRYANGEEVATEYEIIGGICQ